MDKARGPVRQAYFKKSERYRLGRPSRRAFADAAVWIGGQAPGGGTSHGRDDFLTGFDRMARGDRAAVFMNWLCAANAEPGLCPLSIEVSAMALLTDWDHARVINCWLSRSSSRAMTWPDSTAACIFSVYMRANSRRSAAVSAEASAPDIINVRSEIVCAEAVAISPLLDYQVHER